MICLQFGNCQLFAFRYFSQFFVESRQTNDDVDLRQSNSRTAAAPTTANRSLAPSEGDCSGPVGPFFHERLVELAAGSGVDLGPAMLAVILQACYVGAEEWRKLATTAGALALITHLVI